MYQIEKVEELLREISEPGSKGNFNIVLLGEDGVGKEYYAREIHNLREGRQQFLLVDFEVEHSAQKELIELLVTGGPECFLKKAKTNTFFLRRVDFLEQRLMLQLQNLFREVSSSLDKKPFHFLELGVICSTGDGCFKHENRVLKNLLGEFFAMQIHIPPLRERKSEFFDLVRKMTPRYNSDCEEKTLQAFIDYESLFTDYTWPGNLNELQSLIERACSLTDSWNLNPKSLFLQKTKEKQAHITCNLSDDLEESGREKKCQNLIACCSSFS